jgi:hypothetical protein
MRIDFTFGLGFEHQSCPVRARSVLVAANTQKQNGGRNLQTTGCVAYKQSALARDSEIIWFFDSLSSATCRVIEMPIVR